MCVFCLGPRGSSPPPPTAIDLISRAFDLISTPDPVHTHIHIYSFAAMRLRTALPSHPLAGVARAPGGLALSDVVLLVAVGVIGVHVAGGDLDEASEER